MDKITDQMLANRGVKGLPDTPGLTTTEMQTKLEEIARDILVPKVNEIITEFSKLTAAAFAQIITSNADLMATTVSGYLVDALAVKQQFDSVNSNVANIISQSPKTLTSPFFTASADTYSDPSNYRYLLYNLGDNNFAGIGVDTSGNIIFKTGAGATNICQILHNGWFYVSGGRITTPNNLALQPGEGYNLFMLSDLVHVQTRDGSSYAPIYASAFTQQSSKKYKKNVEDISEEEVSKILELRPVKYDYINENNGKGCYGLIAEEVNEIMTYPVVYDTEGNPDGIDYAKFVPYLIKMVQMQEEKIKDLESKIEDLKKEKGEY